jgi:hypothetical protein
MENSIQKSHPITLSIGQIIGASLAVFTILLSLSFSFGNYKSQFDIMKQDIQEGKIIGKELNISVQQLTIEVKSLRQEMSIYADKRRESTEKR